MARTKANLPISRYSPELNRLFARSQLINEHYEVDFDISFSSLFLAFLVNDDIISKWFQDYVSKSEIEVDSILEERKMTKALMEGIAAIEPSDLYHRNYRLTTSAETYLEIAENFRRSLHIESEAYPLDIHHLMAVFIYKPWVHERDLIKWGFDREKWSNAFLQQIKILFPEELNFWKKLHFKAFQTQPQV